MVEAINEFPLGDERIEEELGDLLFAIVNTSRFLKVNPEIALNKTINKFINRFEFIEEKAEDLGKKLEDMSLDEMDKFWNEAKTNKK
jgi:tetrapyrrole methylase family protein / MazG family protein